MIHTYKIVEAVVKHDHELNKEFLDVRIEVSKDGSLLYERKFAYSLRSQPAEITADLDRVMKALDIDAENSTRNAVADEEREIAHETIAELMPKEENDEEKS